MGEYVETAPEVLWSFTLRWGSHPDADLQMAIATCLLAHLLEHHFDTLIDRVETAAPSPEFARTVLACWTFRESDESAQALRFGRLLANLRERSR